MKYNTSSPINVTKVRGMSDTIKRHYIQRLRSMSQSEFLAAICNLQQQQQLLAIKLRQTCFILEG